jgi:hypothetical protein
MGFTSARFFAFRGSRLNLSIIVNRFAPLQRPFCSNCHNANPVPIRHIAQSYGGGWAELLRAGIDTLSAYAYIFCWPSFWSWVSADVFNTFR